MRSLKCAHFLQQVTGTVYCSKLASRCRFCRKTVSLYVFLNATCRHCCAVTSPRKLSDCVYRQGVRHCKLYCNVFSVLCCVVNGLTTAPVSCVYDMVICPNTNVCVFVDSFCNGVNDCGDNADEDATICGQPPSSTVIIITVNISKAYCSHISIGNQE